VLLLYNSKRLSYLIFGVAAAAAVEREIDFASISAALLRYCLSLSNRRDLKLKKKSRGFCLYCL
jgi:hypothetical protein